MISRDQSYTRNGTLVFSERARKNLRYIIDSESDGADVHPVTQTITSLLAIIIFPWERAALSALKKQKLPVLVSQGQWPHWQKISDIQ